MLLQNNVYTNKWNTNLKMYFFPNWNDLNRSHFEMYAPWPTRSPNASHHLCSEQLDCLYSWILGLVNDRLKTNFWHFPFALIIFFVQPIHALHTCPMKSFILIYIIMLLCYWLFCRKMSSYCVYLIEVTVEIVESYTKIVNRWNQLVNQI